MSDSVVVEINPEAPWLVDIVMGADPAIVDVMTGDEVATVEIVTVGAVGPQGPPGATGPQGPAGTGSVAGMTAGQIPIAASATGIASSANLSGDVTSAPTTLVTTLATVNATVGTFNRATVTVDAKGRVTAASTGAADGGITQLTGDGVAGPGNGSQALTLATVNASLGTFNNITINAKGLATAGSNTAYLTSNQTVTLSGDISGSGTTAITATLPNVNVNVGTFASHTVNAKGLTTAAGNLTGDVTTVGAATTLATVNSNVGTFQGLTLDAKGRVTAAANQGYAPLASPIFTGDPTAPTPATADADTSIATTAYVQANFTAKLPVPLTVAFGGTNATTAPSALTNLGAAALAGAIFTGKVTTVLSAAGGAGFNLPPGAAPTAPANGDIWTTTTSVFARINAVTVDLTANQAITLTGDVTGTGTGSFAATIANSAVTLAKIQNRAAATLLGNPTAGAAAPSEITLGTNLSFAGSVLNATAGGSGLSGMVAGQIPIAATATTVTSSGNLSGAVTTSGSLATTLATNAVATANITAANVTYAKIQNVTNNRVLGNTSGSAAAPSEIVLPLSVANGGTNSATAAAARTALGAVNIAGDAMTGNLSTTGTLAVGLASVSAGSLETSGAIGSTTGYRYRTGTAGPYQANVFNLQWIGGTGAHIWTDNADAGLITTTCDYRIKDNVAPLPSTWDKVKALRPISYTAKENEELRWATDPAERWGLIAHELQETLLPTAATATKDAPHRIQSPDVMAIFAALTRALQEAMARIETLERGMAAR